MKAPQKQGQNKMEDKMNINKNINLRLSKNGKSLILTFENQTIFLNANLVRFHLDVSYTKKNGTHISLTEIQRMKQRSQEAFLNKIQTNQEKGA